MGGRFFYLFSRRGAAEVAINPSRHRLIVTVALACAVSVVGACQNQYSTATYGPGAAQRAVRIDRAVVESFRVVDIREPGLGSGIGLLGGAAAGGLVGNQIGKGGGNALATLGGVLVGGAAGVLAEKSITDAQAFEYVLRKENGELISVTQQDPQPLPVGQRVLVMYGAKVRVVPDNTAPPPPVAPSQGTPPQGASAPGASPPGQSTSPPTPSGQIVTPVQPVPSGQTVTPVQPIAPAQPTS